MDIEIKCREIASGYFGVDADDIPRATTFDDLEADSLDVLELAMMFEEEFGIEIADDEIENGQIKTFGGVIDLVSSKVG